MFVYILQAGIDGPVKIGFSASLAKRMGITKTYSPEGFRVLRTIEGNRDTESWLHHKFAPLRKQGEWFSFDQEMLTVIPPDEDTLSLQSDGPRRWGARSDAKILAEMRSLILMTTEGLPSGTLISERLRVASEHMGISLRRTKSIWYKDRIMITAQEADGFRAAARKLILRQAEALEARAASLRAYMQSPSSKRGPYVLYNEQDLFENPLLSCEALLGRKQR